MAQQTAEDVLRKMLAGTLKEGSAIRSFVNRDTGRMDVDEGLLLDFKQKCDLSSPLSIQEIARDVLGFSNTSGGVLLFGVTKEREIVGHNLLDPRSFREMIGAFTGTRLSYRMSSCDVAARGRSYIVPFIVVERAGTAAPNLLQRDMELFPQKAKKIKYRVGSLFYREKDQTKVEPPGDELFERCLLLDFTYATPRSRSGLLLANDRPGFRIYEHINDRFFGRDEEINELLAKLESPRVRGLSLAGMGGIGKTELAIELVLRLWKQRRFKSIYSGTAKDRMMTPLGAQRTDPMFHDYVTFVADLAGWLGFEHSANPNEEELSRLEKQCLDELKSRPAVLLYVDNLETVTDTRLFKLLDDRLPDSVTLLTTSRVHKLKGGLVLRTLDFLSARAAARLLRHELQRQGLDALADTPIADLERKCEDLYKHPLAVRWFAWACARDQSQWNADTSALFHDQNIELFCIDHTLKTLSSSARKIVSAIAALQNQIEVDTALIIHATGLPADVFEQSLWDLQCSGLVRSVTDEVDGRCVYSVVRLAMNSARELARKHHWEAGFAKACSAYTTRSAPGESSEDPLITDLAGKSPRDIRYMTDDERNQLLARIQRIKAKKMSAESELAILQLEAECYRHSDNILTAKDRYCQAADKLIKSGLPLEKARNQDILLEAATVLKQSGSVFANLTRAVRYLEAISSFAIYDLRVFGMLAEMHAMLGNEDRSAIFHGKLRAKLDSEEDVLPYKAREAAESALTRAEMLLEGKASGRM